MKNILVSLLMVLSLSSFAKKKKKPEPAFKKKHFTAIVGTGYPNVYGYSHSKNFGPINLGIDYQASKRWSFGLQYSYNRTKSVTYTKHILANNTFPYTIIDSFQYQAKETYHSIMATADICYVNRGRVCLSSGIGLGYSPIVKISYRFLDNKDHSAEMRGVVPFRSAFRLRLVNAKVKIKDNFGVYGGINYGIAGFLLIGAHYTFKSRYDE